MKKTNPYKVGDRVYWYSLCGERRDRTVDSIEGEFVLCNDSRFHFRSIQGRLKPKKKKVTVQVERWENIYQDNSSSYTYTSKKEADKCTGSNRIACVKLTGSYEREE